MQKQRSRKNIVTIIIALVLLVILIFIGIFLYLYFKSPEKQFSLGANIEEARLSPEEDIVYIKLAGGAIEKNITKIKFIFKDINEEEYSYETAEGTSEISVPFKRSFWQWLFGKPAFEGRYDYQINSDAIGLENFENIEEVSVVFEYETEEEKEEETPVLDTEEPTPTPPTTTGGGGGGGGPSPEPTPPTCTDTDMGINYTVKRTTQDSTTKTDNCNNSILIEYYCNGTNMEQVEYNCSLEDKICQDGVWVMSTKRI